MRAVKLLEDRFRELSYEVWSSIEEKENIKETTITDNIMKELNTLNSQYLLAIDGQNEGLKGADIEWWILYPGNDTHNPHAIHMRIQAKKLHRGKRKTDHQYKDLNHKNGKQMNNLISKAVKDCAIPMYCFYNYYFDNPNSYTKPNVTREDDGWRYAYANNIQTLRTKNPKNFKELKIIDPSTKPMHELAMLSRITPMRILNRYITLNPTIKKEDLCNNVLPSYVFKALEDYQFPNHKFLKQGNWFEGVVSKKKQKYKEEQGKRKIAARIQPTFRNLMNFLSFGYRKLPRYLIIVIAEEAINSEDRRKN
ncbi:hypothetical protein P4574_28950 [Priestia megaterium]|uniref:DUF6615 family protein n=1 Tax=Priestia megaterium TaxID=1404 RepID=UPI002E21B293|nr:hypothetical protein [Priestia megaterium]